ncbi:MAG: ABC transporter permease [Phycisphaerales bacterium]|nr:ABC transporter permease [Phycisphaerales bacterium]
MSFFLEIARLGIWNLRLHLLRSILTSIGIMFGVAAVIVMVALGEGNKQAALREIQKLGATNVIVRSQRPPESGSFGSSQRSFVASFGLTRADLARLEHFLTDAAYIVPLKSVGSEISRKARRTVSQSFGTTPDLLDVANLTVEPGGRYLSPDDIEKRLPVAVIGADIVKQFFPLENPVGQEFRIDRRVFRVIGVLSPIGLAGGSGAALLGRDLNADIHIPITTAELEFGDIVVRRQSGSFSGEDVEISEVYITTNETEEVVNTASRAQRIIEVEHPELSDVKLIVPWELLEARKKREMIWNIVLVSIAAISLVVGGIGIMNIMLASVTERIREIGVRRAVGATRAHILAQFLVETGSLSAVGGLLGIALGIGLSAVISTLVPWILSLPGIAESFDGAVVLETQVTAWSIIVAFVVSAVVGLVFGIYPAIVASRQDPIVALRHD